MGITVEINVIMYSKIREVLDEKIKYKNIQLKPSELLDKIADSFGMVINGYLIIQQYDGWDEYDPYWQLIEFFNRYYGFSEDTTDIYDCFGETTIDSRASGNSADDVADELGIELPELIEEEE